MTPLTKEEATLFFSEFYGGKHHIPNDIKEHGYGWSVLHYTDLSSYDFDKLTTLVFMAHDNSIRVEVAAVRNGIMRISISKRNREGSMWDRHPTLEQAIETFRKTKS